MKPMSWVACGAALAGLAVAAGAFGAHGLTGRLKDAHLSADDVTRRLQVFETAARYQMYHAVALLMVGLLATRGPSNWLGAGGWCFLAGIVIFCGCLYGLALGGPRWLGAVVPLGGVGFIAGWVCLTIAACRAQAFEQIAPN